MKFLYLLFALVFFLFQAAPGSANPLHDDTIQCKSQGNFCLLGACPSAFAVTGTCRAGTLNCCTKVLAK